MRRRTASPARRMARAIVTLAVALSGATLVQATALDLEIKLRASILYEGDTGQMDLRVSGGRTDLPPRIAPSPDWEIRRTGARPENYRRERWVKGKHQIDQFHGAIFSYAITPQRTGQLHIGNITIDNGRTQQHHDGPLVTVRPPDTDATIRVFLTSSDEASYVGQSTTITLTIEVAPIKGTYAANEPIWPDSPPHVSCNLFDQQELPGIDRASMRSVLQSMLSSRTRTPAFTLNNYESETDRFPFTGLPGFRMGSMGMDERALIRFRMQTERIEQPGGHLWRYSAALPCTFNATGRYTFGPASVKGEIIREADSEGYPVMRHIFVRSDPLVIDIESAPRQGRPTSYIGVMATNLQLSASLDTQTCNVGDPLTLTLSIEGDFDRSASTAPAIQHQRNLTGDFTVYGDTVHARTTETGKRYEYQLRPRLAGTLEVPPLEVSFYDTTRNAYITVQTQPIPVRVNEADHLSSAAILAGPSEAIAISVSDSAEEFTPAPLLPIATGSAPLLQLGHRLLFLLGPLLFLIALAAHLLIRHSPALARRRRRQRALPVALAMLGDEQQPDGQRVLAACRQYLADLHDIESAALNPADMEALFSAVGTPPTATALTAHVTAAFNASFAPAATPATPGQASALAHEVAELLRQLESERSSS